PGGVELHVRLRGVALDDRAAVEQEPAAVEPERVATIERHDVGGDPGQHALSQLVGLPARAAELHPTRALASRRTEAVARQQPEETTRRVDELDTAARLDRDAGAWKRSSPGRRGPRKERRGEERRSEDRRKPHVPDATRLRSSTQERRSPTR